MILLDVYSEILIYTSPVFGAFGIWVMVWTWICFRPKGKIPADREQRIRRALGTVVERYEGEDSFNVFLHYTLLLGRPYVWIRMVEDSEGNRNDDGPVDKVPLKDLLGYPPYERVVYDRMDRLRLRWKVRQAHVELADEFLKEVGKR